MAANPSTDLSYPRPDFHRPKLSWSSLNSPFVTWNILFDDTDTGLREQWHKSGLPAQTPAAATQGTTQQQQQQRRPITVPYVYQCPASGINLQEAHEVIWYECQLGNHHCGNHNLARQDDGSQRTLLRFGGVDYECMVWIDGQLVGTHRGGQVGFDLDVSDWVKSPQATSRLTLRIRDSPTDLSQPRGKQFWKPIPESIFYTPSSGIWGPVWMEIVPGFRICDGNGGTRLRSDDIEAGVLRVRVAVAGRPIESTSGFSTDGGKRSGKWRVGVQTSLGGVAVGNAKGELPVDKDFVELEVDVKVKDEDRGVFQSRTQSQAVWHHNGVALWAPDHPTLYDVDLVLYDEGGQEKDRVRMTAGMRSLSWKNGDGTFRLNGKPFFQTLVLDQGYWPETGLTPPSQEALKADIVLSKQMGFNGCRKHQKVEDPVFLYWADRLGYLVWGEIGNAYEFNDDYVERFNSEWMEAVKRDMSHPCVVTWTPVNESWGYKNLQTSIEERNHIRSLYYMTKAIDPSRPINDNCGWEHIITDLTTYHDYNDSDELAKICSRMEGGILARKMHGEMFANPISAGSTLLDAGTTHQPGAPVICTEFGGVNIAPAKGVHAGERDWGYTTAADPDDLLARLRKLIMAVVEGGHSCGFVYTQLYDIEQEVNGLYSYNRREKVPTAKVKAIMDAAQEYYYQKVAPKD